MWVATTGEGLSPSSRSKIRVRGRAAANFVRYDLVDSVDTSSSRTCSALGCEFVSSMGDIIERGEIEPEGLDAKKNQYGPEDRPERDRLSCRFAAR